MENVVYKVERSAKDAAAVKDWLLKSFPFLEPHASVVALLSQWEEWFAGVLNPDVDPADYDAFSLAPLSELHWRKDWKEVGFFTVATFFVSEIETEVVVSASPDSNLYLWRRDDASRLVICPLSLEHILSEVEQHPQEIDRVLMHATNGTTITEADQSL